ncbi:MULTISPECIES: hypothetical protein [Pseudomonas syringae group]|uniref:hypothetical protein n=1 Tax=Pseudomonas syringae group TaxID=136849 RepID=UPI0006D60130|nr:hypothetical protein [Pseudomonas coronafaciens]KPX31197.1 Uncharacterized protein ALO77_02124 [Pseudomonas coronafaciens pv. garcae]RMS92371.1 hypothetical protein ALP56_00897 [Pseudomonas coronafaciens pv. oryzae]RMT00206.1 hypothetical protein ALP57_02324 [Pseudomonas coronafaciens pv. oryzae]RMV88506.1 hypothetical protein ALP02_03993 [Pseudomonas coronafaciens pv. garcae]
MLSNNDWQQKHDEFLSTSQALLYKSEECLSHLEMIPDDEDATGCLLTTLRTLAREAEAAPVPCIAEFSSKLCQLLKSGSQTRELSQETLRTVKNCLTLISWQVELLDPQTGELTMDNNEQLELLDQLAGLSTLQAPAGTTRR